MEVVIEPMGAAAVPGWCALNSAHTIRVGATYGLASTQGRPLGRVCSACTAKARS